MAKKVTKKTATRRPVKTSTRTTAKRTATALAKRPAQTETLSLVVSNPAGMAITPAVRSLSDGVVAIGDVGLSELKLTDAEEAVLSEPVDETRIRLKPGKKGPPIPYLPHPEYTKWFNRAFGRLGWNIVPVGRPQVRDKVVVCPYVLYIHKSPVAFAEGEQEYFENNSRQSYGDALESTVASALRRCAKRIGVGLEMWDKDWIADFLARHPRLVASATKNGGRDDGGGYRQQERRDDDPQQGQPRRQTETRTGNENDKISDGQRKRLFAIGSHAHRTQPEVKKYLRDFYGIASTADILRKDYDAICEVMERKGDLPRKASGQPAREADEILPPLTDKDMKWGMP